MAQESTAVRRSGYIDLAPPQASVLDAVISGLSRLQKTLPAKLFYDERGSVLFEAICDLPEYYPTRTEAAMMRQHADEMAAVLGPDALLIEYGSGSGLKTRILIDALKPAAYCPIDISASALKAFSADLAISHPTLVVNAICADYTQPLRLTELTQVPSRRKVVYFPGSTIGNFTAAEAATFLCSTCAVVGEGGALLVGVDTKKDPAVLHAAYNDAQGITARFNLNMLVRINRELGADFDLSAFWHHAFYNAPLGRIEMHLVSRCVQTATVAGRPFDFSEGETIHTEISCKYAVTEFQALASQAGFTPLRVWVDEARLFSVHLLGVELPGTSQQASLN